MTKRKWNHRLICMDTLLGRTRTDNTTADLCNAEYAVRSDTFLFHSRSIQILGFHGPMGLAAPIRHRYLHKYRPLFP